MVSFGQEYLLNIPVFLPISFFAIIWQFTILFYILLDFVLTIMVQCFEDIQLDYILYHYFDRILIAFLALDILFSLNTCIIRKGIVILQRKDIALEYVKSIYFVVDLLSLIIAILQLALNTESDYKTYFNFIVFIKIIKVYQLDKNIKRYALKTFNSLLVYQIAKNIIFLALLCHIIGCFAYYIDYSLLKANTYPLDQNPYWLLTSNAYSNIKQQDFWIRYTYCFYFSTSILSGIAYGDLVPQNPWETLYLCFVLLLPLVIYSYIFNAIYNVISKKRQKNKQIKKYQILAKRYLKTLRVSKPVENKLITYLSYIFRKTVSSSEFINSLAPSAKKKYNVHNIYAKFDFFIFEQLLSVSPLTDRQYFRDQLMNLITQQAFPERYKMMLPPDRIKLYYINKGICKRVTYTTLKYSDNIHKKMYACFNSFLTGIISEKLRYQSASFVVSQTIDRVKFIELINKDRKFCQLKEAFFLMRQEKVLYNNQTITGESCFFCHSLSHGIERCSYLRPNSRFGSLKYNYRKPFLRSNKKPQKIFEAKTNTIKQTIQRVGEMGVQCTAESQECMNIPNSIFEVPISMRVYYSEFNISD